MATISLHQRGKRGHKLKFRCLLFSGLWMSISECVACSTKKIKCLPILLGAACSEIEQNMGKRVRKTTRRKGVWTRKQYEGKREKEVIRQTRKDTNPELHSNPEIHCCCVTNVNFAVFMSSTVLQISPLSRLYSSSWLPTNDKCIIC